MSLISLAFFVALGINLLMFLPAYLLKTDKLTDLSYALSFIAIALFGFAYSSRSFAHFLLMIMVLVWATRLGAFLFLRIRQAKTDKRFDHIRGNFWLFLRFWVLQGISVFAVLTAGILVWASSAPGISLVTALGFDIFVIGLAIETISDIQKYRFSMTSSGKWIDTGLWSVSRHPNYLGEILVWIGVFVFALPYLEGSQIAYAAISPLYIATLLLFISGVPILEKNAEKKWGKDPDYRQYKKEVPLLLPTTKSLKRVVR